MVKHASKTASSKTSVGSLRENFTVTEGGGAAAAGEGEGEVGGEERVGRGEKRGRGEREADSEGRQVRMRTDRRGGRKRKKGDG